jgi:hypothetical protein
MAAPSSDWRARVRTTALALMWIALTAVGLLWLILMLAAGGFRSPFPQTEVTHVRPYADFVGREYRVTGPVSALAWNDFPDKDKILTVSLTSPPGAQNRFVSYRLSLRQGQRIRIESAWRHFELVEFGYYYRVSVPDAGLPDGVPVSMRVNSDGVPDPLVYQAVVDPNR